MEEIDSCFIYDFVTAVTTNKYTKYYSVINSHRRSCENIPVKIKISLNVTSIRFNNLVRLMTTRGAERKWLRNNGP